MISPKDFNLLVVDDNEDLRSTILSTFLIFGFNVDAAADGLEALEKIKEKDYQIVITDVRMPRMDGVELLQEIKKMNPSFPKVFVITGFSDYNIADVYHFGGDGLFQKPFNATTIKECISQALLDPAAKWSKIINPANLLKINKKYSSLSMAIKNKDFNIGRLGFFCHIKFDLPEVGEKIDFDIRFNKADPFLSLQGVGKVIWSRSGSKNYMPGVGIEFLHLDAHHIHILNEYLEKNNIVSSIPIN